MQVIFKWIVVKKNTGNKAIISSFPRQEFTGGRANERCCSSRASSDDEQSGWPGQQAGQLLPTLSKCSASFRSQAFLFLIVRCLTLHQVKAMICIIANLPITRACHFRKWYLGMKPEFGFTLVSRCSILIKGNTLCCVKEDQREQVVRERERENRGEREGGRVGRREGGIERGGWMR